MKQIYPTTITSTKALSLNEVEIFKKSILLFMAMVLTLFVFAGKGDTTAAPELVFINPVLVSGTANKEGAVYRFSNVTTGVDAEIKLKKFSRPDIIMKNVDLPDLGWGKAFQPQFGLPGNVAGNQNWYVDFECTFYEAGKNKKQKMERFDLTSLDVDGDGSSLSEYVVMEKPKSIVYSSLSSLTKGIPDLEMECGECGKSSVLVACSNCSGTGRNGSSACGNCNGNGKLHDECDHAWDGSTNHFVQGTILNFANIDTAATQVMATYTYENKDKINFRMGGKTDSRGSNGAGIRLNSLWFRSFSLAPQYSLLPVKLQDFSAAYNNSQVNLKWASAQENQFSHFIVEKSFDGTNFYDLSILLTSDNSKEYTFTDANVVNKSGVIYYRLKMVNTDKNISFSSIRVVRLGQQQENATILTYPNPTINEIRVTIPSAWQNNPVSVTVYDQTGQVVKHINRTNASQTETIAVNDLQKGIFIIKAATSTEQVIKRFVKIK